jgi:DNA invertase Pin-like site-specific DNA recombinase
MALYGYARVSSGDQSIDVQCEALVAAGCTVIRHEKVSGTSREGRGELETLLAFLRPGDTLVCTRIDRLARSVADLQDIVKLLRSKGAYLKATEQPIDMSTPAGKAFLDMLSVFAEFETALRKERQMEGIAKAKAEGRYTGRKATIDPSAISALKAEGLGASEIARRLGIGRASVYRLA